MSSDRTVVSPVEIRCAKFLCDITALGENFSVIDPPPGAPKVPLVKCTLGQLFDRLANPGETVAVADRTALLAQARELLHSQVGSAAFIDESTVLGEVLA